ncbi:atypical/Alpha protein kinase [Coprinopsis cinerea okayama7|uniref:Atypical/Alpha protein kinase n=1 Tax=Coprinopsis cinerea (strain Okayama-7 / 130 / ATCC MYA-4618 / FGSC 9003) TaxID=240176 RepID=A8NB56_COPC7|nr:atypical/Alpha protein kinase [Coprinopsis cinerea okayama7\|eukprot:XP_001832057.2 atypical/Alpha protein kinase [Coprinopsis cinerea okayama7\
MARCSGCSLRFEFLAEGMRCGRCTNRPARDSIDDWGLCRRCGSVYEHLEGEICFDCEKYTGDDGAQQLAKNAIANPVDPRKHTLPGGRSSSAESDVQAIDPEAYAKAKAEVALSRMRNGYADAMARAAPGVKVARSKLKGSLGVVSKPVKLLNISIQKMTDYDGGKYRSGPVFHAWQRRYPEDTPMDEVFNDVFHLVVNTYIAKPREYRIYDMSEYQILWHRSKTTVESEMCKGTVGDLWHAVSTNSFLVPPGDYKAAAMVWHVDVQYDDSREPHIEDVEDVEPKTQIVPRSKRANSVASTALRTQIESRSGKKPRLLPAGKDAYVTRVVNPSGTSYTVIKGAWKFGKGTSVIWVEEEDVKLKVIVEKTPFASGVTKKAHKAYIGTEKIAAKYFYDIHDGSSSVLPEENLRCLKDELLRLQMLGRSIVKFLSISKQERVSVYNLRVPESYVLRTVEGEDHAWLADPLFEGAEVQKFSGTSQAGSNSESLVGQTCDALAHFSFHDSEGSIVFVDIQGFDSASLPMSSRQGRTAAHALTLFDVMIHSVEKSYGLGDQGTSGLEDFVSQHRCNSICKALGLTDVTDIWKEVTAELSDWEAQSMSVPDVDLAPKRSPSPVPSDKGHSGLTGLNQYGESESSEED